MAKKMYYTEQEAAEKLSVKIEDLAKFVRDDKLRVFQDGPRKMYKVDEVDKIAPAGGDEILLTPAESSSDSVTLGEEPSSPPGKEDTVITAEGISIFDDEDLEVEAADPMAKTQIAPTLDDQITRDGVGSGSGLLDLTRESDDTSLGAEVLDHIEAEAGVGSDLAQQENAPAAEAAMASQAAVAAEPAVVEIFDPLAGLFGGLAVAGAVIAVLLSMVLLAALKGDMPGYVEAMKDHLPIVLGGLAVLGIALAGVGYALGKGAADRQAAMSRMGG